MKQTRVAGLDSSTLQVTTNEDRRAAFAMNTVIVARGSRVRDRLSASASRRNVAGAVQDYRHRIIHEDRACSGTQFSTPR